MLAANKAQKFTPVGHLAAINLQTFLFYVGKDRVTTTGVAPFIIYRLFSTKKAHLILV